MVAFCHIQNTHNEVSMEISSELLLWVCGCHVSEKKQSFAESNRCFVSLIRHPQLIFKGIFLFAYMPDTAFKNHRWFKLLENGYEISFTDIELFRKRKGKEPLFEAFAKIYRIVGRWKETRLSVSGDTQDSNYFVYCLLKDYNDKVNPKSMQLILDEERAKAIELRKPVNPYEEGTDEWSNWEIDRFNEAMRG